LSSPEATKAWKDELKAVSDRIITMRSTLKQELIALGTKGNWDHITK